MNQTEIRFDQKELPVVVILTRRRGHVISFAWFRSKWMDRVLVVLWAILLSLYLSFDGFTCDERPPRTNQEQAQ